MMNREQELAVVRRAFAKQVMAAVGLTDARVETSSATVERERYLGPGPWPILRSGGYIPTPDADPVDLYSDVLIGIVPERGLNNGMPSYHMPFRSRYYSSDESGASLFFDGRFAASIWNFEKSRGFARNCAPSMGSPMFASLP
jgi:hypothetical protein